MGRGDGPKFSLVAALEQSVQAYPAQIAADLWHHYHGLDLRDLYRPHGGTSGLTYRLLGVLLAQLPGESAYKTALRDAIPDDELAELASKPSDGHGPWSRLALLVADEIDELRMLRRDIVKVLGGELKGDFVPYPRPGVGARRRKPRNPNAAAIVAAIAEEHARLHGYWVEPDAG
jgi:hypothetical protein